MCSKYNILYILSILFHRQTSTLYKENNLLWDRVTIKSHMYSAVSFLWPNYKIEKEKANGSNWYYVMKHKYIFDSLDKWRYTFPDFHWCLGSKLDLAII